MTFELRLPSRASLTDLAADRLREAIVVGHFKPGERLVETRLSQSFGISRAPLREALRVLAADGLVELRQNRGAYVVSPSGDELEAMILARALAEGTAARLVTARADAGTLQRLASILARQTTAQGNGDNRAIIELHWLFHRTLCEGSGNRFLLESWLKVSTVMRIYPSLIIYAVANANNAVFLSAIQSGNPGLSEQLLRSQILVMSYGALGRSFPSAICDYIGYYIEPDGRIVSIEDHSPDAMRVLLAKAGHRDAAPKLCA